MKVLVIDDRLDWINAAKRFFKNSSVAVVGRPAKTVGRAIALVDEYQPDIVCLDLHLTDDEESEGFEIAVMLTAEGSGYDVKILSTSNTKEEKQRAQYKGLAITEFPGKDLQKIAECLKRISGTDLNLDRTKTTVIISYNNVVDPDTVDPKDEDSGETIPSGWHGGEKVFIHANDAGWGGDTGRGDSYRERASNVMTQIRSSFYGEVDVPVENVAQYYIYSGKEAMRSAIDMAKALKEQTACPVTVVACDCDWQEKVRMLRDTNIPLIQCECGGRKFLGCLVKNILAE